MKECCSRCPEYGCIQPKEGNTRECCKLKAYEDELIQKGRDEAVMYIRKMIKIFWSDWNRQSKAKLSRVAYDELDEWILEQADVNNGREFMAQLKQY